MNNINDIFLNHSPAIDLHGLDRITAEILVKDFIKESVLLNIDKIIIIHGVGKGIIKKHIHNVLLNNKSVKDYKTHYFNQGITVVELKIKKNC